MCCCGARARHAAVGDGRAVAHAVEPVHHHFAGDVADSGGTKLGDEELLDHPACGFARRFLRPAFFGGKVKRDEIGEAKRARVDDDLERIFHPKADRDFA
jgi:hypothetical protein